jgi:NAD-dependent dihydropyrimidine dehydrogenase PreA subunit
LDIDCLSLPLGSSRTLTPVVLPENATDKTVTWSSSDASVATVSSNGTVTGIKEGRATISAQCGEIVATCPVDVFEAIREDYNPNTYLLYRENPTTRSNGEDYYRTASYMPGVSGSKVEMKFQLTGPGPLTSGNTCRDYYRYIDISQSSLEWNEVERDDGDYYDDLETFPIPSATSLLLIRFDGLDRTMCINGRVFSCSRDSMSLPHLFASYGHESDEGIWESYDGVPDGSKLYYVKVWDADDTLNCLCYATTSVNPETNRTEYCWCSYYPKTGEVSYTFANDARRQGGFEGFTYGE